MKLFLSTPGERIQVWKYQRIKQDIYHQFSGTLSSTIHMLVLTFQSPQRAAACTWSRNFSCIRRTAVWNVRTPSCPDGSWFSALFLTVSGGDLRGKLSLCSVRPLLKRFTITSPTLAHILTTSPFGTCTGIALFCKLRSGIPGLSDMCILSLLQGSDCSPLAHTSVFERQQYIKKYDYCTLSKI